MEMPRLTGAALVRVLAARRQRARILVPSGSAIDLHTRALAGAACRASLVEARPERLLGLHVQRAGQVV